MPDKRLERNRAQYRCNRSFVLVPWQHCDCNACAFARLMLSRMRAGLAPDGRPYDAPMAGVADWCTDHEAGNETVQ